jgi:hypothetical protein
MWATQSTKRLYSHPQTCLISINRCDNVRPNQRGTPTKHFGNTVELKRSDTKTIVMSDLTALLWNNKINVNTLTKMHHLPAAGDLHVDTLWNESYRKRHVVCVNALWFLYNPAFASIFLGHVFKHNQQDATLHNGIYYYKCSTCFRRFLRPSSRAQNCTHSIRYLSSFFCFLLLSWVGTIHSR